MRSHALLRSKSISHLLAAAACALWLDAESAAADPSSADPGAAALTMRGYDPRIQAGIDLIYSLRFEEADLY